MDNNQADIYYCVPENTKRPGSKICGSVFMSIFLLILSFALVCIILMLQVFSKKTITKVFDEVDVKKFSAQIIFSDLEDDKSIADYMYNEFSKLESFKDMPKETFSEFVNQDVVPVIADYSKKLYDIIFEGKKDEGLDFTIDDIKDIISSSKLSAINNIKLSESDETLIQKLLDKFKLSTLDDNVSAGEISFAIKTLRFFTSTFAIGIVAGLMFIIIMLILIVNKRFMPAGMLHIAIPFGLMSLFLALPTLSFSRADTTGLTNLRDEVLFAFEILQDILVKKIYICAGAFLTMSIIFFALSIIYKKKKNKYC